MSSSKTAFVSGRMLPGTEVDPFALFDGAHHGLGLVARDGRAPGALASRPFNPGRHQEGDRGSPT